MTRISTVQIFQQGQQAFQEQQFKLGVLQQKISTGRALLRPSDDPHNMARSLEMDQVISRTEQYLENANVAENRLALEETVLGDVGNILIRIKELSIQGNNATQSPESRKAIATEIDRRFEALLSLSNTVDANGDYLFGGFNTSSQPFNLSRVGSQTSVAYSGDDGQRFVQISQSRQIAVGDPGSDVFLRVPSDGGVATEVTNGAGLISPAFVYDPQSQETVTLTFADLATNAVGGITTGTVASPGGDTITLDSITYEFIDATGGAVVSNSAYVAVDVAPGADEDAAADALETEINAQRGLGNTSIFVTDNTTAGAGGTMTLVSMSQGDVKAISANGLIPETATATGAITTNVATRNASSDTYTITFTSANQYTLTNTTAIPTSISITGIAYSSGDQLEVDGIRFSITGAANGDSFIIKTAQYQDMFTLVQALSDTLKNGTPSHNDGLARALEDIDKAHGAVLDFRTRIGGRLNAIDSQRDQNEAYLLQTKATLSSIRDLDYAEAISQLQLEQFTLEAAQATFARIADLTLFNFI